MLPQQSTKAIRNAIRFYYTEKFFNKWMSKYDFPQLNYQQKHYVMRRLWAYGSVAMSKITTGDKNLAGLVSSGEIDMKENLVIFTPWVFAERYNIYDFPTHVRLVNTRGVKFITPEALELDVDVVVIWAQKNHKSVFSSIEAKLNELIDIEMKKRAARKTQAQSWLFAFDPEDFAQVKKLQEALDDDNPFIFAPLSAVDRAKGFSSGAPYITDKIEMDRQKVENDILTMIGVNNVGVMEKKEHLVVDEINANNQDIEEQDYSYQSEIEEGFDRGYKALGFKVDVIDLYKTDTELEDRNGEELKDDYVDED